jgi:hypothetical protein
MKCIFLLLIAAACALAVEQISDETMFADVSNTIELMKKKGATEADCKDLAKTSCKEVSKERITDQKIINKQKTGRHCVTLGQKGVKTAETHWKKTKKIHMSWKVKVTKAANFRVHFSSQRYASMKPGHCGFIFGSRSYLSARARYNRYTKIELQYRARVSESWKMVVRMKQIAARQVHKCFCSTKIQFYRVYRTLTSPKRVARQNRADAKCKMMKCVLNGTPLTDKRCKGTVTVIKKIKLFHRVNKAKCIMPRRL